MSDTASVLMLQKKASSSCLDPRWRLRASVKRLVIELGYLESGMSPDNQSLTPQDAHLLAAASNLDAAIDHLNKHLTSTGSSGS